jgi:hypothetical protein
MHTNLNVIPRDRKICCRAKVGNVIVAALPIFQEEFEIQLQ